MVDIYLYVLKDMQFILFYSIELCVQLHGPLCLHPEPTDHPETKSSGRGLPTGPSACACARLRVHVYACACVRAYVRVNGEYVRGSCFFV